jgi:uncharacterized protein YndB with AHSA1/START domain
MIRREIVLPASQEDVWVALTRSEELSAWFGADVDIDPRPRGVVTARHRDGTTHRGTVVAASAPYRLVVVWEPGTDEVRGSRLEFTLEPVADGTLLTVIEAPLSPAGPERFLLEALR